MLISAVDYGRLRSFNENYGKRKTLSYPWLPPYMLLGCKPPLGLYCGKHAMKLHHNQRSKCQVLPVSYCCMAKTQNNNIT